MKLNTVDKALRAIELLSENPRGLRLSEMSAILDIPQSSLHHVLSTLSPFDYVQQDPETKKYSLGFRFLEISKRILDNMDLRTIARKHLDALYKQSQESTHLSILRNKKLVFIEKIGSPVDKILLYCYHYDPTTGKYGMVIANVLRLAGGATILILGSFLLIMFWRERKSGSRIQESGSRI
jgi:hypothetical protein